MLILKFAVFDFCFCRAIQNTPSSGQLGVDMDEQIDEPSFGAVAGRGRKSSFCDGAVEMEEPVSQPVPRQRRNRAMIYSDTSDSDSDKSPPSNNNFPVTPLKSSSNEADTPKISSPSKRRGLAFPYVDEAVVVEFQPITVIHRQRIKGEKAMEYQPIIVNHHQRIKGEKTVEFQPITVKNKMKTLHKHLNRILQNHHLMGYLKKNMIIFYK